MQNVHSTHCSSSIVENPLLIQIYVASGELLAQLPGDKRHDGGCVVSMGADGTQRKVMKLRSGKDIESFQV